jgi:hypothetical protein
MGEQAFARRHHARDQDCREEATEGEAMSRTKYHPTPPSQRTHGHSFVNGRASPEYNAWSGMKSRCINPNVKSFHRYGSRGIRVCDRWLNSFENFLDDMGPRPSPQHSLDRYPDNDGNYEPGNCRWATIEEQAGNRSNSGIVSFSGEKLTVRELSRRTGIPYPRLKNRIARGWPIERAIGDG